MVTEIERNGRLRSYRHVVPALPWVLGEDQASIYPCQAYLADLPGLYCSVLGHSLLQAD